ncbi:MAG: hypothetical protein ACPL1Y_00175 [Thermoplasmata archaeon]
MQKVRVALVLCAVLVSAGMLVESAPVIPYNQYGFAYKDGVVLPENSTIYAWIDGVCYANATVKNVSVNGTVVYNYEFIVLGDDVTNDNGTVVNPVKEGGLNEDVIYFTYTTGNTVYFANQTSVFVNGSSVEKNLSFYSTTQKALINEIVAEPGDGGNDYVYLYFPDISSINLQNWKLEKCGNGTYSAWNAVLSTLTTQIYPEGSNYLYVDLGGDILSGTGGSLKLLWYSDAMNTWVCVDRVEWNASTGGTHNYAPSNTIMPDATGATTSGMSMKRVGNPPQDTDNCTADFIVTAATARPPATTELSGMFMVPGVIAALALTEIWIRRK